MMAVVFYALWFCIAALHICALDYAMQDLIKRWRR